MSARARAVLLACLAMLLFACDTTPARSPSSYPARRVFLDVELPTWGLSNQFALTSFSRTLRDELSTFNITVDDRPTQGEDHVRVNLGLWDNHHAIDVGLDRGGQQTSLGRVLVPDRSMTTLDVAAELVAGVIARGLLPVVDPAPPPPM
jgi:hypothetical protein